MAGIKRIIFSILEGESKQSWITRFVNFLIVTLVFLNVFAVIIQTEKSIAREYDFWFSILEDISIAVFTIEYLLRLWVCDLHRSFSKPHIGRLKYLFSPMAIIDLLSIMPFYMLYFTAVDFRFITTLRFFRLLRIFKLRRYSHALHTLGRVVVDKKEELVITFVTIIALLIMSSSLMYYIEHDTQPEQFSSIPETMWWGVVTLTTVGYGDMVPVTVLGKVLSACIAMLGIGMFALPAALLSSGFTEHIKNQRRRQGLYHCPHCKEEINGKDLFND